MAARRQNLACDIAKCALDHYDRTLPSNNGGKPQAGREWTVYAAIVAVRQAECNTNGSTDESLGEGTCSMCQNPELWVVSCATGSKCTSVGSVVSTFPTIGSQRGGKGTNFESVTGTGKCGAPQSGRSEESICRCYNGMVLKDSHAETLARRGLVACLWNEVEHALEKIVRAKGEKSQSDEAAAESNADSKQSHHLLLEVDPTPNPGSSCVSTSFRLKKDITLHMYVSDSPCGDATLYEIETKRHSPDQKEAPGTESQLNFTGAKIILSGAQGERAQTSGSISSVMAANDAGEKTNGDDAIALGREDTQQLGALRIKSSRSNIPPHLRSLSMSCSDKLVRWGAFGLQGSLLATFVPAPVCLSSIAVSRDPRSVEGGVHGGQRAALERALSGRIAAALRSSAGARDGGAGVRPPDVAVVDQRFESSKSASESRHLNAMVGEQKRTMGDGIGGRGCEKRQKACKGNEEEIIRKGTPESNHDKSGPASKRIKKQSSAGTSINWHQQTQTDDANVTEITIGATGMKRGKRPRSPEDVVGSASRLSRFRLSRRCRRCIVLADSVVPVRDATIFAAMRDEGTSYARLKRLSGGAPLEESFRGPLEGWIRSGGRDDFAPG